MLELDYTNTLDRIVGTAHGISKVGFEKAAASSKHLTDDLESARKTGNLGFADLPFDDKAVDAVIRFARERSYPNLLLLGIGGSTLGPAALQSAVAAPG